MLIETVTTAHTGSVTVEGTVPIEDQSRVSVDELLGVLRQAGIRDAREVACVVLESTGAVSVIRTGRPLDRALFADLPGSDRLPARLFRA